MAFGYTDAELDALDSTLSKDRLHRYVRLANGDRKKAIQFYEMNNVVSEAFFGAIRGFEVALRNSIHNALSAATGGQDWYEKITLAPSEATSIAKTKETIQKAGLSVVPSRVIAELTLGFWCSLMRKSYDAQLWVPYLHKAFPNQRVGRKAAFKRVDDTRQLRNRIAHHECLLDYNLATEYSLIIDGIHWICPITAEWIRSTSTLHERLAELANIISPPVALVELDLAASAAVPEPEK